MNKAKSGPNDPPRSSAAPALRKSRPDKPSAVEPDARNADDKDGNESHADARGIAKPRPKSGSSRG